MSTNRLTITASLVMLICPACVLREEKITISRSGAALIELKITGTEAELTGGDAMPSSDSGWEVERRIKKENDEEKLVLTTSRRIAPGEAMPGSLADPDDPDADLYLEFPTEVRVERRADGTYYFFHRSYTPRRWAFVQYWHEVFMDDDVNKLGETPLGKLNRDDQRRIIQAFASVEARRQVELAGTALLESGVDVPVEEMLGARLALLAVYKSYDLLSGENSAVAFGEAMLAPVETGNAANDTDELDRLIDGCESVSDGRRDACYDETATSLFDEARSAYTDSLRDGGHLTRSELAAFSRSHDRARRRYEITDALAGHHFETTVVMPGTMVAHNANELQRDESTGQTGVIWQFDGRAFRDRTHQLWAVSRVGFDEADRARSPKHDDDR
ncbi:MAG: hypothetical protein IH989_00535 [Planctomycetes bacterium]|nr:hypothetical protein [Planctomycetota bacterium]